MRTGDPDLTAAELASKLNMSERTLHRRLAERAGRSPRVFIEAVRFDLARTALETRQRSVQQIAADSGFSDEASFRRAFKRCFGLSPAEYRRRAARRTAGGEEEA